MDMDSQSHSEQRCERGRNQEVVLSHGENVSRHELGNAGNTRHPYTPPEPQLINNDPEEYILHFLFGNFPNSWR